jgi:cell division protein DivIC
VKALALSRFRLPRMGIGPQVVITILVLGLLGAMGIEPTRQLLEQRERISTMASDLQDIERSNDRLAARIDRLKDPDFLEQRAREQIGLVRPGETAIVVMPPSKRMETKQTSKRRSARQRPPAPEPFGFFDGFLNFVGLL